MCTSADTLPLGIQTHCPLEDRSFRYGGGVYASSPSALDRFEDQRTSASLKCDEQQGVDPATTSAIRSIACGAPLSDSEAWAAAPVAASKRCPLSTSWRCLRGTGRLG